MYEMQYTNIYDNCVGLPKGYRSVDDSVACGCVCVCEFSHETKGNINKNEHQVEAKFETHTLTKHILVNNYLRDHTRPLEIFQSSRGTL